MATSLHAFIDIFHADFEYAEKPAPLSKIVIPIIQRDYAQGRKSAEITRVRSRFLDSLFNAITESPITLDFVYGDIDEKGVMTPLDGQQRLTTLFLLHWYAAKKEKISYDKYSFLNNFSYEVRYSARNFCEFIVKEEYQPCFDGKLSDDIKDQSWFSLDWLKDPTISSMLVMLDAIAEKFSHVENIWEKLCGKVITFYFLPIKDMGLTDELYIRMNSRGKPLTMFEHFKAELERELTKVDGDKAKNLISKIDREWTDMLWKHRGDSNITDDEFLRYFRFICDIICYKSGGTMQGREMDEFDLLGEFFSAESNNVLENVKFLEAYYDCWCEVESSIGINDFFEDHVSNNHQPGKILADNGINFFEEAIRRYGIKSNGTRSFSLGETVMLYAFVTYFLNRNKVTDDEFRRRIRIIRNLVKNSEDEISDSETRAGGNRMPAILKQVDSLIIDGKFLDDIGINFNRDQITEEKEKLIWTQAHSEESESLYELEDYHLLYGQIGIVGLDHPEHFRRFINLFNECGKDEIDCALLAIGNYMQREKNGWRYQLGSSSNLLKYPDTPWRELFHRRASDGFVRTKECLGELLSSSETFTNDMLISIKDEYLRECVENSRFDWRYYYLKYKQFRPGLYGKYWWSDFNNAPYCFVALWTRSQVSENAFQPFLKAVDNNGNISRDHYGMKLVYKDTFVECCNDAYVVKDTSTKQEVRRLQICQEDGIDTEDRIQKYLNWPDKP